MFPFILGAAAIVSAGTFALSKTSSKNEKIYTTKDASELLGISEYSVRKKIRDGDIKAEIPKGKASYRIKESDLYEYISKKTSIKSSLESLSPELLNSIIDGKQLELNGLRLHLQKLELDDDNSNDFKKKKLNLEIAINELESEIQTYQTAKIAINDSKNNVATK